VIFALDNIEAEILTGQAASERSHLQEVVDREMLRSPGYWQPYYTGTPEELHYMRRFSFSDRIRYYWSQPAVAEALDRLLTNLKNGPLPTALISQYLPGHVALSAVPPTPEQLIDAHIQRVMDEYRAACFP
jgi:D-tagatose-1,6-bisphosphate aldolase subunit GatZ/KbaZ